MSYLCTREMIYYKAKFYLSNYNEKNKNNIDDALCCSLCTGADDSCES